MRQRPLRLAQLIAQRDNLHHQIVPLLRQIEALGAFERQPFAEASEGAIR